ncbi:MAG: DAK2 domain-containing protein, partial [Acidipropionibacterium jensenii]|nr:DAK2 domain-containing protein [Acidipropionibacterium jensenii]
AWSEQAGGTSGALWGAALTAFGSALGDDQPCRPELVVRAAGAALEAVTRLGGAQLGDKTMVDAMEPFVRTLQGSTADLPTAWGAAVLAADQGARSTAGIVARLGRSRPLGEKSLGTPDPGAVSFVEVVRAVGSVID